MANTMISTIFATSAVLALAACGGGGSGSGTASNPTQPPPAEPVTPPVEEILPSFNDIYLSGRAAINSITGPTTSIASLPVGTATYSGAMFIEQDRVVGQFTDFQKDLVVQSPEFVGFLSLEADFSNSTIGGKITDIRSASGERSSGEIVISAGNISGSRFTAALAGNMDNPTILSGSITGNIEADFFGQSGDGVKGTITGRATRGVTLSGLQATTPFKGMIGAVKD